MISEYIRPSYRAWSEDPSLISTEIHVSLVMSCVKHTSAEEMKEKIGSQRENLFAIATDIEEK